MRMSQSLQFGLKSQVQLKHQAVQRWSDAFPKALNQSVMGQQQQLKQLGTRLGLLDPHLVLERGYAWLTDESGQALTHADQFVPDQKVQATLADGQVNLQVKA